MLVLGAAGLDVVGHLESELKPATSNPARIRRSHGGVARNVAENLARLGQPVRLITVVGETRVETRSWNILLKPALMYPRCFAAKNIPPAITWAL